MDSNFIAARRFAEFGMRERLAGRRESASGPGSTITASAPARALLASSIQELGIRTVLDLGCGDWNWMRHLGLPTVGEQDVEYEGWDASEEMIESLNREFGKPGIRFTCRDITTAPIPPVDLVIARDVLFHINRELAAGLLHRIERSTLYLAATSFDTVPSNSDIESYLPIVGWGFYRINLGLPPFSLASALVDRVEEVECSHGGFPRFFCLYKLKASSTGR